MSTGWKGADVAVALGLRALKGGAAVVGVVVENGEPRVVLSTFLATCAEGDRLAFEPYHVAAEMQRDSHGIPSAQAAAAPLLRGADAKTKRPRRA